VQKLGGTALEGYEFTSDYFKPSSDEPWSAALRGVPARDGWRFGDEWSARRKSASIRQTGIRGLLVYCSDYKCSHNVKISADEWPDHVRLSDLEPIFTCQACGIKGAEVRADFNWARKQTKTAGT
jgi:hypothetical protein